MNDFQIVYLFTENNSLLTDMYFRVVIGIMALLFGVAMGLGVIKKPKWIIVDSWDPLIFPSIFVTLWGIIWFSISLIILISYTQRYNLFVDIYNTNKYEVTEGIVQVISIQPKGGHAPGDIIHINGVEFEINYYSGDFGYEMSIAHNGVLTEGQYAKVFYYDGRILRIDVKQ